MLFGKCSKRIGTKVSNHCSIIALAFLLPMKKLLVWKKMLCSGNLILCRLANCDASIFALHGYQILHWTSWRCSF